MDEDPHETTALIWPSVSEDGNTLKTLQEQRCNIVTRELTEDNLEKNFATNTLGTHIITEGKRQSEA